jgi:formate hydrogenlyase subunit 6/NADH:ubiquinone oxidoreductase subunit I
MTEEQSKKIEIYVMGKKYRVPDSLTIMKALEYAGYKYLRGCGCRGGFCGACATVYRLPGDYKLHVALACQEVVQDGMYVAHIPFYPADKEKYDIGQLAPTAQSVLKLYPTVYRCVSCNTCTKACPQDIQVMDYVQATLRGDIAKAADISFPCIMCGLCASRCPAEIPQFNVAILARRLYSKHIAPPARHLADRMKEIEEGKFDEELEKLTKMKKEELQELYTKRDMEPK